jgi:hypothetical protein
MINFVEVQQAVRRLKTQLEAGEIDQTTFEAQLLELVDIAEDGYYWMFGHKTETWYRHDGQQWVIDSPGELVVRLPKKDSLYYNSKTASEPPPEWESLDWGWFLAALVFIGSIAYLTYLSVSLTLT